MSHERGRPVLGAIFGLLFGLFLAVDLLLLGLISLDSPFVVLLPVVFLIVGIAGGLLAPLGSPRRT